MYQTSTLIVQSKYMENPKEIADQMLQMGKISLKFGRTYRITLHEDGVTRESDTDHSFMLGLIAGSLVSKYLPRLNRGRVMEFALLHDLVEVHAGDVPTFKTLTPEQKKAKDDAEHKALLKIQEEFGDYFPWIHGTIEEYERKDTPEARFVKIIDKMMAKITHILNDGAVMEKIGATPENAQEWHKEQSDWADEYMKEWPEIRPLWDEIIARSYKAIS